MKWRKKIENDNQENVKVFKTLETVQIFDDVWVKEDNKLYDAWVCNKTNGIITVVVNNDVLEEQTFHIKRPLNVSVLKENNKVLMLEKEAII